MHIRTSGLDYATMLQAYASVQLNADLGLSDYVYGLGSGIFFLGYMAFQVRINHEVIHDCARVCTEVCAWAHHCSTACQLAYMSL